jgi:malate synthase
MTRALEADRTRGPRPMAGTDVLPGRQLLFVRNVGHLMTNPAILLADGSEIPEGIMDAVITGHRRARSARAGKLRNSRARAASISSSPRCTGRRKRPSPTTCSTRSRTLLGLERHTIKVGVMDEERRTSGQPGRLHPCGAGPHRVHQHRLPRPHRRRDPHLDAAGPMIRKGAMKGSSAGSPPMKTAMSASAWPAGFRARRRSARACGPRPT